MTNRITNLSPVKLALTVRQIRSKTHTIDLLNAEPIAIIGMACRFPGGANDPDLFWKVLHAGVDAITEVPPERWDIDEFYDADPSAPGKMYTRFGGFLPDVDKFDAPFFRIAPREASGMDPQQRLLLENSWEAVENAGISPVGLAGTQSGVFIGITTSDYLQLYLGSGDPNRIEAHAATGNSLNAAAGRISYVLGLQGPSIAVDTACSSSLVAVHLACESLRKGECNLALAGGVSLVLAPSGTIALCRARMLAPDGRCKTFDAAADGYVRSEGCGIVVLKRLADALRDRDSIRAIVRGSAVNQDGASSGLTVPNGLAQETVIRRALHSSGIEPGQVAYVEAHGTGTALGDPIEVRALSNALGGGRTEQNRLLIGSVKTNVGHLEAAAGIAGLIKLVLALEHETIPPQLHFSTPNPHIPLNEFPVEIASRLTPWPRSGTRRIAGVSSFGATGTNAHVLVEEAPKTASLEAVPDRPLHPLCISAKSESALRDLADRYRKHFQQYPERSLSDVCYTANAGRAHFRHRLCIITDRLENARERLEAFLAGQSANGLLSGAAGTDNGKVAFLFTGQASQYRGMGRELYQTHSGFRRALDQCDALSRVLLGRSVLQAMYPENTSTSELDETIFTQSALFALEYALAELWRSWGIVPSAVMGHSLGEYVAACVAGVFSLEDAMRLVAKRSELMQAAQPGVMAVVHAGIEPVKQATRGWEDRLSIASINGPDNTVVSGTPESIAMLLDSFALEGIRTQRLAVNRAFHSPCVDSLLGAFEKVAAEISYSAPRLELVSNVTGQFIRTAPDARYWRRHTRETVQFWAGMTALAEEGYRTFVEIGPSPTLLGMGQRCLPEPDRLWIPSLRKGRTDWHQVLESLASLYVRGFEVDWQGFDHEYPRRRVSLPTYPFLRERYWVDRERPTGRDKQSFAGRCTRSPLVRETIFESVFSTASLPFLADHRIYGTVVVPASCHVSRIIAACETLFGSNRSYVLEDLTFPEAIVLRDEEKRTVQLVMAPEPDGDAAALSVISLPGGGDGARQAYTLHSEGHARVAADAQPGAREPVTELQARLPEHLVASESLYPVMWQRGFHLGASFCWIRTYSRRDGEALGRLECPEPVTDAYSYPLHPGLLDSCFQLLAATLPLEQSELVAYAPIGIRKFTFYAGSRGPLWCHATLRSGDARQETQTGDLRVFDDLGRPVAEIQGLCVKRAPRETLLRGLHRGIRDWFYEIQWQPQPFPPKAPEPVPATPAPLSGLLQPDHQFLPQTLLQSYDAFVRDLDVLSLRYVLKALRDLGCNITTGQPCRPDELADRCRIVPEHRRLWHRLLEMLREDGIARPLDSGEWEILPLPDSPDPGQLEELIAARYPELNAELVLLQRCARNLAAVLQGRCDPLQLLFPGGSLQDAEQLYENSPFARAYNQLLATTAATLLQNLPAPRILEIGAGTGGTTTYVLPLLPTVAEYAFTDISPLFTARAADKFARYPFMRYQVLDIEQDPSHQGFQPHAFDLVIAANVLHATSDLARTLNHARQLIRPGGSLLLLEGTGKHRWIDLVFGLTEGWWKFSDLQLRPSYPLISAPAWLTLLRSNGFHDALAIPADQLDHAASSRPAVILAQTHTAAAAGQDGNWIIFADRTGVGQGLAQRFAADGQNSILVYPGDAPDSPQPGTYRLNPAQPEQFVELFRSLAPQHACRGIVHLWALDTPAPDQLTPASLDAAQMLACGSALHLLQAIAQCFPSTPPRMFIATQKAQPLGNTGTVSVAQSSLWGLGRVIQLEYPEVWGALVDLDESNAEDCLFQVVTASDRESEIAFRGNQRYVARLAQTGIPFTHSGDFRLSGDATFLITGGLGGLGIKVADWLVRRGARHIVLLSRRRALAGSVPALEELRAQGATIVTCAADVSEEQDVAGVLEQIRISLPPLRGIVHAAGVLDDGVLLRQDWSRFAKVMAPKVRGAWNLHNLTASLELDFFILFSSVVSLFGSPGQGNHAAGNSFMDCLAHFRRRLGLPGLSINWGAWGDVGTVAQPGVDRRLTEQGIMIMSPDEALQALELLIQQDRPQVGVLSLDWAKFAGRFGTGEVPSLLSGLLGRQEAIADVHSKNAPALTRTLLLSAPTEDRRNIILEYLVHQVATVLKLPRTRLETHRPLSQFGFDSLMALELKSRVERDLVVELPVQELFGGPSVDQLADRLTTTFTAQTALDALSARQAGGPDCDDWDVLKL